MNIVRMGIVVVAMCISACATFNPYIRHTTRTSDAGITSCLVNGRQESRETFKDPWVAYACGMATRIERARSEITGTRATLTSLLFPMGGIIAYNATRGFNAPTNAALTAGGFAGYGAVTTLAQRDRIRIYDAGLTSISCAIGTYELTLATTPAESPERLVLRSNAISVRDLLRRYKQSAEKDPVLAQRLRVYHSRVDGVESWLTESDAKRALGPSLAAFVRQTIASLNEQLTLTVPTNAQIAPDALASFQAQLSGTDRSKPPTPPGMPNANGAVHPDPLESAIDGLRELLEEAQGPPDEVPTKLDLTGCAYKSVSDASVSEAIRPLHLGANNEYAGKTVSVIRGGSPFKAGISGGIPPYTATLAQADGPDKLTVDVSTNSGRAELQVSVPDKPGLDAGTYLINVEDASQRYLRWVIIKVPSNKP